MAIAVCGGAGYIGSHVVQKLIDEKRDIVVVDTLECGHKKSLMTENFAEGNIGDYDFLKKTFDKYQVDTVIHLCAYIEVGESVLNPAKYYQNNVVNSLNLLNVMKDMAIKKFVFSSTAATYGEPEQIPLTEDSRKEPTNPYGETKLSFEKIIKWYNTAYGINYTTFRYFNVAGAHPNGHIGEDHNPESHLIPLILQVPMGKRENIKIFGSDYNTPDGTCVRDYIHVCDLANVHVNAIDYLDKGGASTVCNLGNGNGFSVKEVIEIAKEVTGFKIPVVTEGRRAGDSSTLVASSEKAKEVLGFKPAFADLKTIISTAWNWHKNHPKGYNDK